MTEKQTPNSTVVHIHVPKTGGTWLNRVLEEHLGPRFIGGDHAETELTLLGKMRLPVFMAMSGCKLVHITLTGIDENGFIAKNLLNAPNIVSVGIVRNPFDLLVSLYSHDHPVDRERATKWGIRPGVPVGWDRANAIHGVRSFDDFIKKLTDPEFPWCHGEMKVHLHNALITEKNRSTVNRVLRQEFLVESTRLLLNELSVPIKEDVLQIEKSNTSTRIADYRSYYTDELRELVEEHYGRELELFGYDFDGIAPGKAWKMLTIESQNKLPSECIDTYTVRI
jgi:hypothetical protein